MKAAFLKFIRDERGATAIEYGIIAGLMAVALVAGFAGETGIPKKLETAFGYIGLQLDKVKAPTASSGSGAGS